MRTRWAVLAVALVAVAACSGDDDDDGAGGDATSTTAADEVTAEQVEDAALVTPAEAAPAAGAPAVDGTLDTYEGSGAARAEILEVVVGERATFLRWWLRSTDGEQRIRTTTFSGGDYAGWSFDVAIVDRGAGRRYRPYAYEHGTPCTCSMVPVRLDADGQEMSGLYPRLDGDVETVEVHIPGFPPVTGVPVTRGGR